MTFIISIALAFSLMLGHYQKGSEPSMTGSVFAPAQFTANQFKAKCWNTQGHWALSGGNLTCEWWRRNVTPTIRRYRCQYQLYGRFNSWTQKCAWRYN